MTPTDSGIVIVLLIGVTCIYWSVYMAHRERKKRRKAMGYDVSYSSRRRDYDTCDTIRQEVPTITEEEAP